MGSEVLSTLLGWMSIGCWLGAQFPQVLENIRRQSCEGLALPFLANWLLGDITNFVGCILTHQLPFQTILAGYFCSVDFTLFAQYFYYSRKASSIRALPDDGASGSRYAQSRRISADPAHAHVHYREISDAAADLAVVAAIAADDEAGYSRRVRSRHTSLSTAGPLRLHIPTLSEGTAVTSLTAAGDAATQDQGQWADEEEDAVDEGALAALADSFHSEHGWRGSKRVSWSQERFATNTATGRGRAATATGSLSRTRGRPHSTSPLIGLRPSLSTHSTHQYTSPMLHPISTLDFPTSDQTMNVTGTGFGVGLGLNTSAGTAEETDGLKRGRPLRRQVVDSPIDDQNTNTDLERQASILPPSIRASSTRDTAARRSSRASKRSAGLVFLGVWALVGIGGVGNRLRGRDVKGVERERGGVVLSDVEVDASPAAWAGPGAPYVADHEAYDPVNLGVGDRDGIAINIEPVSNFSDEPEPSPEQILGRISAWTCTTLYLTSRLPQIWKNFVRKSVEGLSMYLFVFAFLGNTFYVASILTSPNMDLPRPEALAFLKESTPYLLGSAGTLLFDVTIVLQSFIYRSPSRLPRIHSRSRTHSLIHSTSHLPRSRANSHIPSQSHSQSHASSPLSPRKRTSSHPKRSSSSSKLGSQVRSLTRTRSGSDAPYRDVDEYDVAHGGGLPHTTSVVARTRSEGILYTSKTGASEEEALLLGHGGDED